MNVLLIINLVFFLFLAIGFLAGLKGAKKSALRLALFIVGVLLAACIAPVVSKSILQIKITYNNEIITLGDVIINFITSLNGVEEFAGSSETFKQVVQNLPIMIGNLVVFVGLSYVLSFISWIVYLIFASIFVKNKKVDENGKKYKEKKYRLVGGLIGALQALILMFVTFLPINGFVGIIADIYNQPVVAEETVSEKSATQKLIDQNIPKEVLNIILDYNNSIIAKTSGIFGLDDACFNSVSSINIDGNKIVLRDEILTISKVYDNVAYLTEFDFSSITSLNQLNFNKLRNAINAIFDSNLVKTVLPDASTYVFDKMIETEELKGYKNLLNALKTDLTGKNILNLKSELLNIVDGVEVVVKNNLIDEFETEKVNIKSVCSKLSNNNYEIINKLSVIISNSKIINKVFLFEMNYLVDSVEQALNTITSEPVSFNRIDINSNLKLSSKNLETIYKNMVDILNIFGDVSFKDIEQDYSLAFNKDFSTVFSKIGETVDCLINVDVLKSINFYDTCINGLQKTKYANYINFAELKNDNAWQNEANVISSIYNDIIDSRLVSYIFKENIDVANIIDALANTKTQNGKTQTYLNAILEPLFESKAIKKVAVWGAEQLDEYFVDIAKMISETAYLGKLHTDNLFTETEKAKVLSALDNIVEYLSEIDLENLKNDPFMTVINSDLIKLATALDSLKATELFGDVLDVQENVSNGVYTNLIKSLQTTAFKDYIGFDEILSENFSWNEEIANTEPMIKALLSKKIVLQDKSEVELIKYIVDGGEWNTIFDQITTEDLEDIFTPLLTSKIFKPTAVMVINEINGQIKNVVGDLGIDIVNITEIDENQVTQIVEVIDKAKDLMTEFSKDDFKISDLATGENKEKLASLLDTMQTNANENGVFTQAYDSLLEFIQTDTEIGEQVTQELVNYDEGQINWAELINKLVK